MRLLIATSGMPEGDLAVRFGAHFAARADEAVAIVTVVKHESERRKAESILDRAAELFLASRVDDGAPVPPVTSVRVGHPAEELVREAEEGGYGLAVVGAKQHQSLISRFRLGSTALRVVEHAPCPVAIVKRAVEPSRRFMVCDSGIQSPPLVARVLDQLGELMCPGDHVSVVHVMSQMSAGPGILSSDLVADADELIAEHAPEGELLERDRRMFESRGLEAGIVVRHGLVVDEIAAEAREGDYEIVVIGAHRGTGWRRILLDDLTHQIVECIDRPVVVVR